MRKKNIAVTIFNLFVIVISVTLIVYFCLSDNGLLDLIHSDISVNAWWLIMATGCQLGNMLIDSLLTFLYIRQQYQNFTFFDGLKSSFIGSFFSAVTPSASGGQPMQVIFLSQKNIEAGFSTSCMTQKFVIFQIVSTILSVLALIIRFDFFRQTVQIPLLWLCVIVGFVSQITVTGGVVVLSFSKKISEWLIRICQKLLSKLKFIKNPEQKISVLRHHTELFHYANKSLLNNPVLLWSSCILIFIQILFIFLVPYCIYRSFSLHNTNIIDMLCSQSFVSIASAMMPLPGATGASELAFSVFFALFFGKKRLKSALLLWRTITYYGVIILCFPFSLLTSHKKQ